MNALVMSSVLLAVPADDPLKGSGLQCTVSTVGCVYGQLGKFDASSGLVCDIATLGDPPKGKCKYRIELFVGVDVKEKVIFLGQVGAKAGLNITCDVEMEKGPIDKSVIEKQIVPRLLSHPDVKKAAGDRSIKLVPDPKIEIVTPAAIKKVREGFVPQKKK